MDFNLPCLNPTTEIFLLVLIISYYFIQKLTLSKRKTAPEASGAWPIIGHLHFLGGSQPPHITLGAMAEKYGPIFTLRLGLHSALVVSNQEMAKECFLTNDASISSRPKLLAAKHLGYNSAMFAFSPYGTYWRELRKITTLELLTNRRVELFQTVRVSEVETSLRELYMIWTEKKKSSEQVLVELDKWLGSVAMNVALRVLVGKRYFGATNKHIEKDAQRCKKAIREFVHQIGLFVVADAIPYLRWLDWGGHEKAMIKTGKDLDEILQGWLDEHKQRRDSGEVKGDEDFMYILLSTLDGKDLGGYDADTINKSTTLVMISGGSDTVTVTLTWAISLLLNNPHTLKKVQEELDFHLGRKRLVHESDIGKLIYLQLIVKETLRLYPPLPLLSPREFTKDCTVGGYHISKGTRFIPNVWKIHTDPKIWSDPLAFKPERFLNTHNNVDVKGTHFELIPFGSGRRMCPGISFALPLVHLILASFLQAFEIKKPSNQPVDMSESFGLANMKTTPLEVLITPRLTFDLPD